MPESPDYDVELMPPGFDPGGFDCGEPEITEYLTDGDAAADSGVSISKTYLVRTGGVVVGYFSVLADSIRLDQRERPPGVRYGSVPALKLGRMGVSRDHRGRDIGIWILKYVVGMARYLSQTCGCRYVTLDALQRDGLLGWYERFGFVRNRGESKVMRLIRKLTPEDKLPHVSMRYDIFAEGELPVKEADSRLVNEPGGSKV